MNLEDLYRLLRTGHVQAQGIVDTLEEPLLVLDQGLCVLAGNLAFFESFGVTKDETLGQSLFNLGDGQWDIPELRRLLGEVAPKSHAVIGYEVRHDFPTLGPRVMLVSARRMIHPDSISPTILVMFEDVTDQRHAEAEKDILLAETRHRMGNLLAMIRAMANQTKTEGRSAAEYRDAFLGRFQALIDAQDLTLSGHSEISLGAVIDRAMALAGSEERIVCRGPSVPMTASQAVAMNLILNELCTNALKYGALSVEGGRVVIEWSIRPSATAQETLFMEWREEEGPPVAPPTRRGFGSDLIEFSAKQELRGKAEQQFPPEGFRCLISAPMG